MFCLIDVQGEPCFKDSLPQTGPLCVELVLCWRWPLAKKGMLGPWETRAFFGRGQEFPLALWFLRIRCQSSSGIRTWGGKPKGTCPENPWRLALSRQEAWGSHCCAPWNAFWDMFAFGFGSKIGPLDFPRQSPWAKDTRCPRELLKGNTEFQLFDADRS